MGKPKSSRKSIAFGQSAEEVISQLADSNIGAVQLLSTMPYNGDAMAPFIFWCNIDDLNLRGEQIWVAFKYWKDSPDDTTEIKIERFRAAINAHDPELIAFINERCPCGPREQAMDGASYKRR